MMEWIDVQWTDGGTDGSIDGGVLSVWLNGQTDCCTDAIQTGGYIN